jgi:hypothetical protein
MPLTAASRGIAASAALRVTVGIYSICRRHMRFKVYLLRRRGRRLSRRDVFNGRTYVGTLVSHTEPHNGAQYNVLQLQPSDPMSADRPPKLYEPVLLGFAPLAFRLRGFERVDGRDGGYGVVQEWHVAMP